MSEKVSKVEQKDIVAPQLHEGETSIVFQRHGKYNRDRSAPDAGSLYAENAAEIRAYDEQYFRDVIQHGENTYVLFVSSDTQYAASGYRSLETGQIAQDAAAEVMVDKGLDPNEHIINFNPAFAVARHKATEQAIRPLTGIREPQIFAPEDAPYFHHLQEKYGYADDISKTGLSPRAWAMHEMDAEAELRQRTGTEGQEDLIARTEKTLAVLERYAKVWHANNPGKRLVIWTTSHYDTISPIVKKADGVLRNQDGVLSDAYQPVDYGGGASIVVPAAESGEPMLLVRQNSKVAVDFGRAATKRSVTGLNQPQF